MSYLSDKDYEFIYSRVPRLCIDLLLVNPFNEFLLTKRDIPPFQGQWHFPGGRLRMGEVISDAIHRIAGAELGIDTTLLKNELAGFCEFPSEHMPEFMQHSVSMVFKIELPADLKVSLDRQSKYFQFFHTAPEIMIPAQAAFLRGFIKVSNKEKPKKENAPFQSRRG